jgi:hypothetical protein
VVAYVNLINHRLITFIDVFLSFGERNIGGKALSKPLIHSKGMGQERQLWGKDYDTISFYNSDVFQGITNIA